MERWGKNHKVNKGITEAVRKLLRKKKYGFIDEYEVRNRKGKQNEKIRRLRRKSRYCSLTLIEGVINCWQLSGVSSSFSVTVQKLAVLHVFSCSSRARIASVLQDLRLSNSYYNALDVHQSRRRSTTSFASSLNFPVSVVNCLTLYSLTNSS